MILWTRSGTAENGDIRRSATLVWRNSNDSRGFRRQLNPLFTKAGEDQADGTRISRKRIERIMRKHGICGQPLKRFKVTTDSKHDLPIAENLLDQNFEVEAPNTRWSGDITYLWTGQGWLYLAVILDLWSRRVVGWSMQANLERALALEALDAAIRQRQPQRGNGLICHSDRGSQYASFDYQTILRENGIACSMSRKGNCYDNAPVESFFASLKR